MLYLGTDVLCCVTADRLGHKNSYAGARRHRVSCSMEAALMSEIYRCMTCKKHTHARAHAHSHISALGIVHCRMADKNITGPSRQLNKETQQSVLAL